MKPKGSQVNGSLIHWLAKRVLRHRRGIRVGENEVLLKSCPEKRG